MRVEKFRRNPAAPGISAGRIKLSYSTFGLTQLDFFDAIAAVGRAGYAGVELAFHREQFDPFAIDDGFLARVHRAVAQAGVTPACIATASYFFNPSQPHEPSLIAPELAARRRRIDLIKRGIHVARQVGAPLVTFGSGFIRAEHLRERAADPHRLLVNSLRELLDEVDDAEDLTLVIEPEPGMFIETLAEGAALVRELGSPHFKLHADLCHAFCSEADCLAALAAAAPETRYLHISDARLGYNLKIVADQPELGFDLEVANTLVYFPDTASYLLVDRARPLYFADERPGLARQLRIGALLEQARIRASLEYVHYPDLYCGPSALDDEIFTYLISIPRLSFDVLARAKPVIGYLRGAGRDSAMRPPLVERRVANTRTGIVHFHEIPGEGTLDLPGSFRALTTNGFSGFGSVELYHHVASWRQALTDSYTHLAPLVDACS